LRIVIVIKSAQQMRWMVAAKGEALGPTSLVREMVEEMGIEVLDVEREKNEIATVA
jgi:hypothetical protein